MAKKSKKQKIKKPELKQKEKPKPRRKTGQKKKFFDVKIPLINTKVDLYGYFPEDIDGKVVKIDLTKSLRGKSLELQAKIKYDKEKLTGELVSLQLMHSYIKRAIRKGIDYVEDSFETECKDATLVIKPFMLTRKRVSRSIKKAIRDSAKKHLQGRIKTRNVKEIFSEIMTNKLQKELSLKIKKIYPLALCEIRFVKVIGKPKKENKQ